MLRRHIIMMIAIRPSNGDVKPGGPLVLFEKNRLRAGTGFHLLPIFHHHHHHHHHPTLHNKITLHKQLHVQSPLPELPTIHYTDTRPTRNVVCPSGAWFENRPHLTPSIHLAWNPKRIIVQWVGIGTHTLFRSITLRYNKFYETISYNYLKLAKFGMCEVHNKSLHCLFVLERSNLYCDFTFCHWREISGNKLQWNKCKIVIIWYENQEINGVL